MYSDLATAGQSRGRAQALFAGSGTNALLTAELLGELAPDSRTFSAEKLIDLTDPNDILAGDVALWRFIPAAE